MIVSFQHSIGFIAVPKTGTHAVREAVRPLLAENDWEQCRLFEEKAAPLPTIAQFGHGHLTAAQLRGALGEAMFDGLFSFAVVRNPFDRFVSLCAFMARKSGAFAEDPRGVMLRYAEKTRRERTPWNRPQADYVFAADGTQLVTHVARYENLQAEVDAVRARMGAAPVALRSVNASKRDVAARYYDEELIANVAELYAADFAAFGYMATP